MKRLFALAGLILLICGMAFAADASAKCDPAGFMEACCVRGDSISTPLQALEKAYLAGCPEGDLKALDAYIEANFKISPETVHGETAPVVAGLSLNAQPEPVPGISEETIKCVTDCMNGGATKDACNAKCTGGGGIDGGMLFEIGIAAAVIIIAGAVVAIFLFTRKKEKELVKQMEKVKSKIKSLEGSYLTRKIDEGTYRKLFEQYQLQLNDLRAELSTMKKKGKEAE